MCEDSSWLSRPRRPVASVQGLRAWPVTLGICGPLGGYFINNTVCSLYALGKGKDHSPELRVMGEPTALVSHLLRHLC